MKRITKIIICLCMSGVLCFSAIGATESPSPEADTQESQAPESQAPEQDAPEQDVQSESPEEDTSEDGEEQESAPEEQEEQVEKAPSELGKITAQDVNMRAEADEDSEKLETLQENDVVIIRDAVGEWYSISFNGKEGYVLSAYVFRLEGDNKVGYVLEDGLKLRGTPSSSAYIIDELKAGDGLKLEGFVEGWYRVSYDGETGYIHQDYLNMGKSRQGVESYHMLKMGMEGSEVERMQRELKQRGFFVGDVTGMFGSKTRDALKEFQKAAKLDTDGVAGAETLEMVYGDNGIKKVTATRDSLKGTVKLLSWFDGGSTWFGKGTNATVIDVRTGITFKVQRFGGWYHADVEPLTKNDTAKMKKAVGGSWTWNRRPIWVKIGGTVVAASMNAMPHLSSPIGGNDFDGHFCIHLYKSKVHETSRECPRHQACVQEAYRAGK